MITLGSVVSMFKQETQVCYFDTPQVAAESNCNIEHLLTMLTPQPQSHSGKINKNTNITRNILTKLRTFPADMLKFTTCNLPAKYQ